MQYTVSRASNITSNITYKQQLLCFKQLVGGICYSRKVGKRCLFHL